MSDAPQIKKKPANAQLTNAARLKLAEHDFAQHSLTAELGTTIEQVVSDEYLAHFATKFKPYDEITVRTDDGTWYAKLLVLSVGRAWVKTFLLEDYRLTTADVEQTQASANDAIEVLWRGPVLKFSVIRKSDRSVLKEKIDTKAEAAAWAAENA